MFEKGVELEKIEVNTWNKKREEIETVDWKKLIIP